jgi:amino acid transporter
LSSLPRAIGVSTLTLSVINCIVGSAIFVVPATVGAALGPAAILGYLAAGVPVVLVALCFAEVGSRVSGDGGAIAFVDRAFGPWAGFVVGTLTWLANGMVASAAVANALVGTVGAVVPALGGGLPRAALLIAIYGGFAWINVRGTAIGAGAVRLFTVAKLVPLVLLVAVGVWFVQPANLVIRQVPGPAEIGRAALLLVFALTGMEIALTSSGEVKDPTRTIPRAAVFGVLAAVALYLAVHEVAQGVLGPGLGSAGAVPLAVTAERVAGPIGRAVILVGTIVSIIGYFGTDLLANPRALFALAERGLLPRPLAWVHPTYRTPWIAVLIYAAASAGLAIAGSFTYLALLSALGVLLIYLGVVLAGLRLRAQGVTSDRAPIRLPGGPAIPLAALVSVTALIATAQRTELLAIGIFLVLTSAAYLVLVRGARGRVLDPS